MKFLIFFLDSSSKHCSELYLRASPFLYIGIRCKIFICQVTIPAYIEDTPSEPQRIFCSFGLLHCIWPSNRYWMGEGKWWLSTAVATERLIHAQLAPTSGQMVAPSLPHTKFAMDWGYCFPSLLYSFFLPSGADIMGTIKQSPMFPFTYDQKLSQNDTRQSVNTKGFKSIFLKNLKLKEKQITGIAYRDGKGGVTLGLWLQLNQPTIGI